MKPTVEHHQRLQTMSLMAIAFVALGGALVWLEAVLVPFILAFILSVALGPLVRLLARRLGVPLPLAFIISSAAGVILLAGFGALVAGSISQLKANQHVYQASVQDIVQRLQDSELAAQFHLQDVLAGPAIVEAAQGMAQKSLAGLLSLLINLTSQGLLVVIFVMFLMAGSVRGTARNRTLSAVEEQIRSYVGTKVMVSALTGTLVWICLSLLGVEMALVFGLFAFLLNFVPNVGSLIATLLPLPILLLGDYSSAAVILAISIPGLLQFAVGNWLEPRLLGDSMDLHPVTILLTLILWGTVWGLVGALLATPLTAIVRILLNKEELTRPLAELMAGRLPGSSKGGAPSTPAAP